MISRRALLGSGAVAATLGGAALAATNGARVITAVDVHPNDYPTVAAVRWMGDEIERETNGRITFRIYPSGQLGTETDTVNLARYGVLDIARVYLGAVNNAFPATMPLALPYIFRDDAHLRRVVDGPIGADIRHTFERRGLIGLAFYDSGFRSIYNTHRPIHTPADMHGLKVRVPRSDVFIAMLDALGANAVPMPSGEVFTGLQTHLIDAAENNWATYQSTRQYEAAPYWSQTDHCCAPEALLLSKHTFDTLSAADKELFLAKAQESVPIMRALFDQKQATARRTVLESGIHFNEADKDAMHRAVVPMKQHYLADPDIAAMVRRIEAQA